MMDITSSIVYGILLGLFGIIILFAAFNMFKPALEKHFVKKIEREEKKNAISKKEERTNGNKRKRFSENFRIGISRTPTTEKQQQPSNSKLKSVKGFGEYKSIFEED